ncbi:hypothetical protein [Chengkuizengella marina]|uniref:Uncharacterized protein n=1 Tax=Chengkuizengella marina TaxID=2507566 RepID=A0A6N9Q1C7_9BACL|nr:hypothetical protein [Chengkuizengella marina]NBI28613.1 hypothetical protein [Chengkuizengella marina]
MKLKLPNGEKIKLNTSFEYKERLEAVNNILLDWEDYFYKTWDQKKTSVCLEILSNYLCMVKDKGEDKNIEDKYILSNYKMKKLKRGDKRMTNFTDLKSYHKKLLGIAEEDVT